MTREAGGFVNHAAHVFKKIRIYFVTKHLVDYRSQTKFAKVMFSQVSDCPQGGVSVSVHREEISVQGVLCPGRSLSKESPWGETPVR